MSKIKIGSIKTEVSVIGDGNVVNTGSKSHINTSINIQKGSKELLRKRLSELDVSEEDVTYLTEIVDKESPNLKKGIFGEKVNTWVEKMIGKSLNGSWQVGIGTAGNLLAEVIKAYYGM